MMIVLDRGRKGTMLQRISTLSIDACMVELKRSLWVAYQKELEKLAPGWVGYLKHDHQVSLSQH